MIKNCFLIGFLFLLAGCHNITGSGNIIKSDRSVGNFTSLKVNNGISVKVSSGTVQKVTVEADDNIIDDVETELVGEELVIKFSDKFSINNSDVTVNVVMPVVDALTAGGGSSISSLATLAKTDGMKLKASGGASINVDVDARSIKMESSGGATIKVKGRAQKVEIDGSGGATVNAYDLMAETAVLEASGGASVKAFASLNVDAKASSGATVSYKGNPTGTVNKKESGGGSVSGN